MNDNADAMPPWELPGRFDVVRRRDRHGGGRPPVEPEANGLDPRTVEALYELCPPGYRNHEVLRRHPRLLVRLARHHLRAEPAELRQGYSDLRRELKDQVPVHVIPQALATYRREADEIHRAFARVAAIERALSALPPTAPEPGRDEAPRPNATHPRA
ncbi:hypothetical protein OG948_43080 (plasmid) [Embleya sp. NBC_00888]|uniref:hypothetical protein n=1 Tax=Embleya sp. NBC_00888 TaxID=2975960 RepID=UPI002F90B7D4|nr:hypothetical protein OG948_43080 [Embleya sp. NBC_00888]